MGAKRVFSTIDFRRHTPGLRLGSIMSMAKYPGQLYTFNYSSYRVEKGGKRIKNRDAFPLLLLAYKDGKKVWMAGNGNKYIYGFNLNYLRGERRLGIIKELIDLFSRKPGVMFSYNEIKRILKLPSTARNTIFRKYDIRGNKLRYLKQVDLNTYADYLYDEIDDKDDTEPRSGK